MKLFRKESLAKVTSLENLDKLLTVVGVRGWLVLLFFILLFAGIILWIVWGKVPITTSGNAILLDLEHTYIVRSETHGIVKEIRRIGGQTVRKGEVIVVLENDSLSRKIKERKRYILSLEQEIAQEASHGFGSRYSLKKRELLLIQEELADLEEQEKGLIVRVPNDGKVIWVDLNEGDRVVPNETLITMQGPLSLNDLRIFAFIPLASGQLIQSGMPAKLELYLYNPEKYGMVLAEVERVMPYPISPTEYYMQKIPSIPLKNYLMGENLSNVLVVIKPKLDPNTYSGLAWTSGKGPPAHIESSLLGKVRVTLEEVKPIQYVLPVFEQ